MRTVLNYNRINGLDGSLFYGKNEKGKKELFLYENETERETKDVGELFTANHFMNNWTVSEDEILKAWKKGEYIAEGWTLLKIKIKAYNFNLKYLYNREENKVIRIGDGVKMTEKNVSFAMNKLLKIENFKEGLSREQKDKKREDLELRIKKDN